MSIDILAALHSASPTLGSKQCKLAATLDEISDDTAGKDALIAAVADPAGFPASRLTLTFSALQMPVSRDLITDHRAKRCRCYR